MQGGPIPFWMKTLSGMSSGAIAVCIGTPFDVALVRMQVISSPLVTHNFCIGH
jgi:hypothetical protein